MENSTSALPERLTNLPFEGVLREIGVCAQAVGIEAYAIGGFVRDVLLGRPTTDIDFVTIGPGSSKQLAEKVAAALHGRTVHIYENFGTAAVRIPQAGLPEGMVLEFVAARRESYRSDSRKPLVEDGTLRDDMLRRDFTINALALHLYPSRFGELIDPFNGRSDLQIGVLRTPLDPRLTFSDDPLRMLRGARFAAQLGFKLDPAVRQAMRASAARIKIISAERIADELQKSICAPVPSTAFRILEETGLLQLILPELTALKGVETVEGQRHKDNFYHSLQVLDNLAELVPDRSCEDTRWLRWAALLHDIGKAAAKRFDPQIGWTFHGHEERGARMISRLFRRLAFPTDERLKMVESLIRLHHRPVSLVDEQVTDSAVRRLLFDAGDLVEDLMLLVRADITSRNPTRVRRYLRGFDQVEAKMIAVEEKDRLRNFQPPVDGLEIMETLGLQPGPAVGIIKEAIREAILDGLIPNEHDAAFAYMMDIKDGLLANAPGVRKNKRRS